jgi:hypothetical protein
MDPAKYTPPSEPLLHASFSSFLNLITAVFFDSILFFLTLGLCILYPRIYIRIINPLARPRWKPSTQAQNDFRMLAGLALAAVHVVLCMLFALHDDLGLTPNAPSVFWAIVWSMWIVSGVFGGFLVASVVVVVSVEVIGV